MNNLDNIDKKIILELYKDGRMNIANIARNIYNSREVVLYRLKRLYKNEIIKQIVPIVNFKNLGFQLYRLQIEFYHNEDKKKEFYDYIKNISQICWLVELIGKWDLVISFNITSNEEFFKIYNDIMDNYGEIIKNKLFTIVLCIEYMIPRYFLNTKENLILKESKTFNRVFNIEKNQINIILELYKDGRVPMYQIAKNLNLSTSTVIYHYKLLKKNEIILAFKPILNFKKLGIEHFKVMIILDYPSEKKNIKKRLLINENVIYITHSVGKYDIEFEYQNLSINYLLDFIKELKKDFNIKEYEIIFSNKEIVINQIPYDISN